ncbi:MAG: calcineurin-like phosphoesterase C-terminal domain-containing protein [Pseudomonadota bacterium]
MKKLQCLAMISMWLLLLNGCESITITTAASERSRAPYFAGIDVIRDSDRTNSTQISGRVFHDTNGNGKLDNDETGIPNVAVSNGMDVTRTDAKGAYQLAVRDDMSLFVIQPSGWKVPTNKDFVPQFSYQHKPKGSPKLLRYGGLPPTGKIPSSINFPLKKSGITDFSCAVIGDIQAYGNQDISYFRDSTLDDILDRQANPDCVIAVGDVMGDDLDLIPRMTSVISTLKAPQWWTHGNHDFDFDADFDADSADSWRNLWGPAYYAFEQGQFLFIVLDNVVYPCVAEDTQLPGRSFCVDQVTKRYNGRVTEEQLEFVRQLLATTPKDKTIVYVHHIPFVSFYYQSVPEHKTDNAKALYALVDGRNVLSISGHTHTIENLAPGDHFEDWKDILGEEGLPFRHIVAGAASGSWYQGDLDIHGTPMALQGMGSPKGWLELNFDAQGNYSEAYFGANYGENRAAWLSMSTPGFRDWFNELMQWRNQSPETRDPIPPLSINDLPDVKILTDTDLTGGTYLTANVWAGSTDTEVAVSINGEKSQRMIRTQEANGEAAKIGADYADPFSAQRQLSVARIALQSRSGKEGNQGYQLFRDLQVGPAVPQPQFAIADRNMHLWTFKLPDDLSIGSHIAEITITDRHGRTYIDNLIFEVRQQRPEMRFRLDKWNAFDNGSPVNPQ